MRFKCYCSVVEEDRRAIQVFGSAGGKPCFLFFFGVDPRLTLEKNEQDESGDG